MTKKIKVLVMSIGHASENGTVKWLLKIHCPKSNIVVCLPKEKAELFEDSYKEIGVDVFVYDEKKYVGKDIEYFGFKPRNCGGVGRQGIAEATLLYDNDETICLQLDDDTASFCVKTEKDGKFKACTVREWGDLADVINAFDELYELTGVEMMATTGATPPTVGKTFANRKIFNNFIMRKGCQNNFDGFRALCSDDYRFNIYHNLMDKTPMRALTKACITFTQNQGDRKDGNAVIYNGDYSWKKAMALKMMCPWAVQNHAKKETNRFLFRENIKATYLYPPIMLADEEGNIVGRAE